MRETEAQRSKLAFPARVTELGSDPRNVYSRDHSLPHLLVACLSCFAIAHDMEVNGRVGVVDGKP